MLPVVDRGWIEVCPVISWTAPDGRHGFHHGTPLAGEEPPVLPADADNWEYPDSGEWIGCPTLAPTEEGRPILW
ncbi:hypothetical protein [Streptomyces sp. NBC_01618]|uniref:hypothetical protein n=1 Tax=Streptomyces sp. NBC_01618 TaxID=2975900 RepID=UPI00386C7C24|nr:hypothetical protein OH735_26155 [Streptomyces sp. NBC_01618]